MAEHQKGQMSQKTVTKEGVGIIQGPMSHTLLTYRNSILVSSFDFTAALMIYRFMPSASFLPKSYITLFSVDCNFYTCVFSPQGKKRTTK